MRNLLLFLIRNQNFFLFVALQLLCLVLLVQYQYYHQAIVLNATQEVVGDYYYLTKNVRNYFQLRQLNDSLRRENTKLHNRLVHSLKQYRSPLLMGQPDSTSLELPRITRDTISTDSGAIGRSFQYRYFSANVINNSINKRNNYLTLDKGREQGLQAPMGLISKNGVAGIVKNVSDHYAVGISVLHNDFSLSCEVEAIQEIGALSWNGQNPEMAKLEDLPTHLKLAEGQTVVTSPYSRLFPPGIPVGRIVKFDKEGGANFYDVNVKLHTQFRSLEHVYAIQNRMLEEQLKLEKAAR